MTHFEELVTDLWEKQDALMIQIGKLHRMLHDDSDAWGLDDEISLFMDRIEDARCLMRVVEHLTATDLVEVEG